jgi:Hydrogenase maturation factor
MTDTLRMANGLVCPTPAPPTERIQLGHGSGGKLSTALLRDRFMPELGNPVLAQLGDAAVLPVFGGEIAFSTDTFVVSPSSSRAATSGRSRCTARSTTSR